MLIYMLPLYFPDDKREYIPAVAITLLFVLGAVIAFLLLRRHSKREEKRTEFLYRQKQNIHYNENDKSP
ncbi:hypothetical protein LRR81_15990 [Metabacillus sp. GX 13764]|uniref:hypothetical protein n=1 Tax=Metabacillus kandeliae TaxID=2900151 RepID=UPI001E2ED257|nr:hypothetical protein [Metabacillus kandeliae]MCD7035745.1 hypothetical protein [Metabacillus kandeliae]